MKGLCVFLLALVAMTRAYPYYEPYFHGYHGQYDYPASYGGYFGYVGHNHEFDYRQYGGYPVHIGNGDFYFLGIYGGTCTSGHNYGFYFADASSDSFVVCDHGRAHRFQCPKGTKNRDYGYFVHNHVYGFNELCGQHTNE